LKKIFLVINLNKEGNMKSLMNKVNKICIEINSMMGKREELKGLNFGTKEHEKIVDSIVGHQDKVKKLKSHIPKFNKIYFEYKKIKRKLIKEDEGIEYTLKDHFKFLRDQETKRVSELV